LSQKQKPLYIPQKWAENMRKLSCGDAPQTMYQWLWSLEIVPRTKFFEL
jgi:hypothetical protein